MLTFNWLARPGSATQSVDWADTTQWSFFGVSGLTAPGTGNSVLIGGGTVDLELSLSGTQIALPQPATGTLIVATNVELGDNVTLTTSPVAGNAGAIIYEVVGSGTLDGANPIGSLPPQPGAIVIGGAPLTIDLAADLSGGGSIFVNRGAISGDGLVIATDAAAAVFENDATIDVTGAFRVQPGVTLAGQGVIALDGANAAADIAGAVGAGQVFTFVNTPAGTSVDVGLTLESIADFAGSVVLSQGSEMEVAGMVSAEQSYNAGVLTFANGRSLRVAPGAGTSTISVVPQAALGDTLVIATNAASVPAAAAPAVSAPAVSAPAAAAPSISAPAVSAPAVSAPSVSAPSVSAPSVSAPSVSAPVATSPSVSAPAVTSPAVSLPAFTVPAFTVPTLPTITLPAVSPPSGALPAVGASFTSGVGTMLQSVMTALAPSGLASPNVVSVSGGGSAPAAVSGAMNAYVVTAATPGSTMALPDGFRAGYLLSGAATLQDSIGGAALIGTAAGATLVGADNDSLFGGNAGGKLVATTGAETLIGGTGANLFQLGSGNAAVTSQGSDTIIGSGGSATINATGAALYFGNSGSAMFTAGGGADTLVGGTGGASVTGGAAGLLYFGTGPSTYVPGAAVDTVLGFTGSLTATGGANGTLFFTGTAGGNVVSTGTGASTIVGFGAGDVLTATGAGANVIAASGPAETISGALATGANTFFAFGANDVVTGGAGMTAIESGLGNHTLVAGSGATLFEILAGTLNRTITIGNFAASQDFVQLQGYAPGTGAAALQSAVVSGGNEMLILGDGTKITFAGVTNLAASSFL
jgi:hypothetical protein